MSLRCTSLLKTPFYAWLLLPIFAFHGTLYAEDVTETPPPTETPSSELATETANNDAEAVPTVEVAAIEIDEGLVDTAAAVLEGIRFHPTLGARIHALEAAVQDRRAAWSGYLPQVDLQASVGAEQRYPSDRDAFITGRTDITVQQTLFDGFNTRANVSTQNHVALVRFYEAESTANDLALQIIEARENVVRYQRLLDVSRDNYRLNQRIGEQVLRRVSSGRSPRVDAEQVTGRLALAESNLLTEAANLHDATLRYQRLTGLLPAEGMGASQFNTFNLPTERAKLLAEVYTNNPQFLASVANVQVSLAQQDVEKSDYYPDVTLRGRQSFNHNTDGFDSRVDDFGGSTAIELVMTYNLYQGGRTTANNAAAQARTLEAQDRRFDVCLYTQERAQVVFNDVARLTSQLAFLERHLNSVDDVRQAYRSQFEIDRRSLLEVLDIETEYLEAARARINGEHDLTIAVAQTLHSMGHLMRTLGLDGKAVPNASELNLPVLAMSGSQYCAGFENNDGYSLESLLASLDENEVSKPAFTISAEYSFPLGSAAMTAEGEREVRLFAQQLISSEFSGKIVIEGHTDDQGSALVNQRLSEARANAAAAILIEAGIAQDRIEAVGYGPTRPVASNNTDMGRQANRRVEIRLLPLPAAENAQ